MRKAILFLLITFTLGCDNPNSKEVPFDIQGHRGFRGLYPENTIKGMLQALKAGATTLEMDVVITADSQVILSHEPFLSHEICLDTNGQEIKPEHEHTLNLFKMTTDAIQSCDCGSKIHPRFPGQVKTPEFKPLLREVLAQVDSFVINNRTAPPAFNIETKLTPETDGVSHPDPDRFVDLLLGVLDSAHVINRTTIQSFDFRSLNAVKAKNPDVRIALLVESERNSKAVLSRIEFKPDIYSPNFELLDKQTIQELQNMGIQVIPWTVNDSSDIRNMIEMGVTGIISDYPDRVSAIYSGR